MKATAVFNLEKNEGTRYIAVIPEKVDDDGLIIKYGLYEDKVDLGKIIFYGNLDMWNYTGKDFDQNIVDEIAKFIREYDEPDLPDGKIVENKDLDTFYFKEDVAGTEHDYRITFKEPYYAIEKDGLIMAELGYKGGWQQISGDPMSEEVLQRIGERIEDHYEGIW